jgi:hypothetical protein
MPATANISLGPRVRGTVLVVAGIVTLILVGVSVIGTLRLLRSGQRAKGMVTALYAGNAHPKIEFVANGGATVVFPGNGFVSHRVGDAVDVLYAPENPGRSAVLEEPGALWLFDASTGVLGFAAFAIGIFLLRTTAPAKKASDAARPRK